MTDLSLQNAYLWTAKNLHFVYLILALPIVLITARITPPFQVADEPNHFCRAEQVSRGRLVAQFHPTGPRLVNVADTLILLPDPGGFVTDKGIAEADSVFAYLQFRPEQKVLPEKMAQGRTFHWNTGTEYGEFGNTALYPATGYLTSALGIVIGRMLGLSVINTLYLSRWLNGIFCVLLCFYALRMARGVAPLLFVVLLFPMTISLFASISQDGVLIALASLFAASIYEVESSGAGYSVGRRVLLVACLVAIVAAKPPYLPLVGILFFLSLRRREKVISFAATLILVTGWMLVNHKNYGVVWAPAARRINASAQLHHIFSHPFHFAAMFFHFDFGAIRDHIWMFIGLLGWEDLSFPMWYYKTALLATIVSMLLVTRWDMRSGWLRAGVAVLLVLAVAGILTGQYVTWMPLDAPELGGVQSRYFIPLVPFLALVLGITKDEPVMIKQRRALGLVFVLLFGLFSQIVLVEGIISRYYM